MNGGRLQANDNTQKPGTTSPPTDRSAITRFAISFTSNYILQGRVITNLFLQLQIRSLLKSSHTALPAPGHFETDQVRQVSAVLVPILRFSVAPSEAKRSVIRLLESDLGCACRAQHTHGTVGHR